ncbi:MAG: hypothetical protein FWH03_02860 [Firmicutes bacterium]|nr:hypothetical protein [Bacillota bacterium]
MEQICQNCKRHIRYYFKFEEEYRVTNYGACTRGGIKKCDDTCYLFKPKETPDHITAPPYTLKDDLIDLKERLNNIIKEFK